MLTHGRPTGLHKSDQQYMRSAKVKKPEEEFLYATTASKRAERQRLVRFIRCAAHNISEMSAERPTDLSLYRVLLT